MDRKHFTRGMLLALLCLFLTGCLPEGYSREQEKDALNRAEKKMEAYFAENLPGAKVVSGEVLTAFNEGNWERTLTDYVRGTFTYQDGTYEYVADIAQGDIYTSIPLEEVLSGVLNNILERLEIEAAEADMADHTICCLKYRKESGLDGSYSFSNVFPAGNSADAILQDILNDDAAYDLGVHIQYKGKDLPERIEEKGAPLASLRALSVYHVSEDMALVTGEKFYSYILPCISSEILQADYTKDSSFYRKPEIAEKGAFRVLYNIYARTRKEGIVTEQTLKEEDILLTVTEDYIELTCMGDAYDLYLFTEDTAIMEKYLYTRKWRSNADAKPQYEKGSWRDLKKGYVFTDNGYTLTPYAFTEKTGLETYSGNRIYTEAGKEKN